jgi:hypothetical protein
MATGIWLAAAAQAQAQVGRIQIAIPPQDLGGALAEFARQTNDQLLFSPGLVQGRQSKGLRGAFTPEEALRKLVAGTGLEVRAVASDTFLLAPPSGAHEPATPPGASPAAGVQPAQTPRERPADHARLNSSAAGAHIRRLGPPGAA